MPIGSPRPGTGRPKGSKDFAPRKPKGRPRKIWVVGGKIPAPVQTELQPGHQTPLEYMLAVMNDPTAAIERRDRMAMAAAPYVHERPVDRKPSKKEMVAEEAKAAAIGTDWGSDLEQLPALN